MDELPRDATPQRELRDPRELRALAHPVRIRLLEELATLGEATATELGARIDESPANCSWHLRQLARYGFIEEAGGGAGRARPWRWLPQALNISEGQDDRDSEDSSDSHIARRAAVEFLRERELQAWRVWTATRGKAPQAWRDASFESSTVNWLTAEELMALKRDVDDLIERHVIARRDRFDPKRRPQGTQMVRFGVWGFPGAKPQDLQLGMDSAGVAPTVTEP